MVYFLLPLATALPAIAGLGGAIWLDNKAQAIANEHFASPRTTSGQTSTSRKVYLGWHPAGGPLADLGQQMITPLAVVHGVHALTNTPNPMHHWAIFVGDEGHELNQDGRKEVVYRNYKLEKYEVWCKKEVGFTGFDDYAIKVVARKVITEMAGPYDVTNNNCQKFALGLLDEVLDDGRKVQFKTTYSHFA